MARRIAVLALLTTAAACLFVVAAWLRAHPASGQPEPAPFTVEQLKNANRPDA